MGIAVAALAVVLAAAPGDALGLDRDPPPPAIEQVAPVTAPLPSGASVHGLFAGLGAAVVALAEWARRRRAAVEALPTTAPEGVRILFVSGVGSETTGTFDDMMDRLGVADTGGLDVSTFDYRVVEPSDSHPKASRRATAEEVGDGLAATLRAIARAGDEPIYLIGHSKGAVAIAELLKRWDLHPGLAEPSVFGAALLDPPMSGGVQGMLQSAGRGPASFIPNDGAYSPRHCDAWLFDCHDTRAHLGDNAGVEVVVFRNPDSGITNFGDKPEGLRVLDISEPEAGGWGVGYIADAHSYPLHSAAVAACIADEMREPGSCQWPIRKWLTGEM